MKRRSLTAMVLCLGILLAPLVVTTPARQKEGKGSAKPDRVEGTVQMIDKPTKTVTVTLRGKPIQRQVIYSDSTKFTFRNKDGSVDDVKDGRHVICLGKMNDKGQLIAARIDVRDKM
jgi:hypothetical protein